MPPNKKSPQSESAGKIYMNPFSQVSGEKGGHHVKLAEKVFSHRASPYIGYVIGIRYLFWGIMQGVFMEE